MGAHDVSRGWHRERTRHSLAARGIRTAMPARALIRPSGERNPRKIKHLTRVERSIKDIGNILSKGYISGNHGVQGLTSAWPIDEGSNVEGLGQVIVSLDPEIMLKVNDLIKVDYTEEFFTEYPEIGSRIRGNIMSSWKPADLLQYKDEQEVVSFEPIKIPPDAVKRIEIHYGEYIPDPITGNEEDPTPWKPGSEEHLGAIFAVVERSIPRQFWDRTFVVGDEGQYKVKDYVIA